MENNNNKIFDRQDQNQSNNDKQNDSKKDTNNIQNLNRNENTNIESSQTNNSVNYPFIKSETRVSIPGVKPEEEPDYSRSKKSKTTLEYNNKLDSTYIFAMGGLEEIGKNTYVVEHNEETLIVDAGIKFATSDLLGVNGLIPNFEYFRKNKRVVDKLIVTHGHEDHIGGIPYLLQEFEVKEICASLLASELIKRKLGEFKNISNHPVVTVFSDDTVLKTKYFNILILIFLEFVTLYQIALVYVYKLQMELLLVLVTIDLILEKTQMIQIFIKWLKSPIEELIYF